MLKKTIKFNDFNGTERVEDYYFNLTEAELMEMELGTSGGWTEWVKGIIAAKDGPTIMKIFKEIILKSYGVKSLDGKKFVKVENGHRLVDEFTQTNAYSNLYMELITNTDAAADFVVGILPDSIDKGKILAEINKK